MSPSPKPRAIGSWKDDTDLSDSQWCPTGRRRRERFSRCRDKISVVFRKVCGGAFLAALLGCGGSNGGGRYGDGPLPLSPYGDVEIARGRDYNGPTGELSFAPVSSSVADSVLSVDASYEAGSPGPRRLQMEVRDPVFDRVGRYSLVAGGGTFLRLFNTDGDVQTEWRSTGGVIRLEGKENDRLTVRLVRIRIAAVDGSDAAGIATINGSFHLEYPAN